MKIYGVDFDYTSNTGIIRSINIASSDSEFIVLANDKTINLSDTDALYGLVSPLFNEKTLTEDMLLVTWGGVEKSILAKINHPKTKIVDLQKLISTSPSTLLSLKNAYKKHFPESIPTDTITKDMVDAMMIYRLAVLYYSDKKLPFKTTNKFDYYKVSNKLVHGLLNQAYYTPVTDLDYLINNTNINDRELLTESLREGTKFKELYNEIEEYNSLFDYRKYLTKLMSENTEHIADAVFVERVYQAILNSHLNKIGEWIDFDKINSQAITNIIDISDYQLILNVLNNVGNKVYKTYNTELNYLKMAISSPINTPSETLTLTEDDCDLLYILFIKSGYYLKEPLNTLTEYVNIISKSKNYVNLQLLIHLMINTDVGDGTLISIFKEIILIFGRGKENGKL